MMDILSSLTNMQIVLVLLLLPTFVIAFIFAWMLLIGRDKDTSDITIKGLGLSLSFNATRRGVDRRNHLL